MSVPAIPAQTGSDNLRTDGVMVFPPRGTGVWAWLVAVLAAVLLFSPAGAQSFPELSGRVVDAANIISANDKAALEAKLKALETKTGRQLVVATVPSLEGYPIEDYANRLFRSWALGEKTADNGVLLLVAPNERSVRIEVGYGLEAVLTDARSRIIIETAVIPQFKAGNYGQGIVSGAEAIVNDLDGTARNIAPETKWYNLWWARILLLISMASVFIIGYISKESPFRSGKFVFIVFLIPILFGAFFIDALIDFASKINFVNAMWLILIICAIAVFLYLIRNTSFEFLSESSNSDNDSSDNNSSWVDSSSSSSSDDDDDSGGDRFSGGGGSSGGGGASGSW